MTCHEWKAFLPDHLAGVLSDDARAAVDAHLSECAACLAEARAHQAVERHLASQPERDVPPGLVDRVVEATRPAPVFRLRREFARVAAAALAAVGLAGGAFFAGYADRLPDGHQLEATRHAIEQSMRGALGVTQLLRR
jgi:anti-sigma factor RsiW